MDWEFTCRICLDSGDMVSLFDSDENNEVLRDKYTYCSSIEVTESDRLPTLICLTCVDRLMFAYQFRVQCVTSNQTLKECYEEFKKSTAEVEESRLSATAGSFEQVNAETEVISIKQENGAVLQYELPIGNDNSLKWKSANFSSRRTKHGMRGRPRKKSVEPKHQSPPPQDRRDRKRRSNQTVTTRPADITPKEEPKTEDMLFDDDNIQDFSDDDQDYQPTEAEYVDDHDIDDEPLEHFKKPEAKKRGRPRKHRPESEKPKKIEDDGEDMLLKETIMAFSEPIPEYILNPKPKVRKRYQPKRGPSEKIFTCETCGSSFTSNSTLQGHINRHLGIKPFVCSVCGYACVLATELRRHMIRHTGEKPYKCRICDRHFGDCGSRQKHERLHMGVRPYKCSVCGKTFTYASVLSNHMLTHTGEKKYSCAPCNRKFTKAHHLKYHNKIHHKELYVQQQRELEAKKARDRARIQILPSGVTGQIVNGTLQFVHETTEEGDQDGQMQVVEITDLKDVPIGPTVQLPSVPTI